MADLLILSAFFFAAVTASHLAAWVKRSRMEAEKKRVDKEKLLRFSDALADSVSREFDVGPIAELLLELLRAEGVAVYEAAFGVAFRAGTKGEQIPEKYLRDVAHSRNAFAGQKSGFMIVPISAAGESSGSIGIAGGVVSQELLTAAGDRLANRIINARLAEAAQEAEIVRRSNEFKSAAYDALAHEVRVPLGAIGLAVTTLLSEKPGDASQQHKMLCVIREEMEHLDRWVSETVRLSKAADSGLESFFTPRSLTDVIVAARVALADRVDGRMRIEVPNNLPMVLCDGGMTRSVLDLLLDNAVKYSPPGTPIDVSAKLETERGMVVITVADTGPGVPEEERLRIFEKSYRGSQHRLQTSGEGLGLASARFMVECQGGEIWVNNRPQGGAAFHFSLPAVKAAA